MLRRAALALVLSGLLVGAPAWAGEQSPAPEPAGSEQAEGPQAEQVVDPPAPPSAPAGTSTPSAGVDLSPTDPVADPGEPVGPVGGPVDRLVRWGLAVGGLLGVAGAAGLYWTRETR